MGDSVSKNERASYHHGDLRLALVQAGAELLEAEGYEATSLRAVAARAGVSHNAPYRHFPDRRALLSAIAADGFRGLAQQLESQAATRSPLQQLGSNYLKFARSQPAMYRLMFTSDILVGNPDPEIGEMSMQAYRGLQQFVEQELPGYSRADAVAATIWSQLHGLALLLIEQRIRPWMREGVSDDQLMAAVISQLPQSARAIADSLASSDGVTS